MWQQFKDWARAKWERVRAWFKDSETIAWARLQMFAGAAFQAAVAVDWSPVVPPKYLPLWLFVSGALTEILRRARATDL